MSNLADLRACETERVLHKAEQFTVVDLFGLPSWAMCPSAISSLSHSAACLLLSLLGIGLPSEFLTENSLIVFAGPLD